MTRPTLLEINEKLLKKAEELGQRKDLSFDEKLASLTEYAKSIICEE